MTQDLTGAGKVSIIIPCYNDGAMLREGLASVEEVRNESLLEVIIVDDGSFDAETMRILEEVAKAGYCVVSQPNSGSSAARNRGIQLAKGEFILPLDSDNRLRAAYLNEGVALLKEKPSVGVVYADAQYFGNKNGKWPVQEFNLLSLIRWNFIDVCALYRKTLWEGVGGYDMQMPWMGLEDWDFWLRVAARGGTFFHLAKIGFDYRVRNDSQAKQGYRHSAELTNYIFGKPELNCYKLVREIDEEVQKLRGQIQGFECLPSYRLGRSLLAPARALRKLLRSFR